MTDEKKPSKEGTKTVETERGPVLGSLISTARIMGRLVGCTMRFVFAIDPDRPIWRPEVIELSASISRWLRSRKERQGGEATAPREKRLTLDEIERLPHEEFEALPEDQKQRYFDWMTRENSPSPWEFYGYEAEREQPLEWPEDHEESDGDEGRELLEGLDGAREITRDVYMALVLDVWPTPAGIIDFGIESSNHYAALQEAVRRSVTPEQLDRALGNGPALTALIGPDNPYHGIVFTTSWDVIRAGVAPGSDSCDSRAIPEPERQEPQTAKKPDAQGLFGEVIFAYSRRQALEDGELVDVTETAKEAGFRTPVALTRAVWAEYVAVPEGVEGQDVAGRLWDILWMCWHGISCQKCPGSAILFRLHVRNDNREGDPPLVTLKVVCGPADDGSPCVTITLPDED